MILFIFPLTGMRNRVSISLTSPFKDVFNHGPIQIREMPLLVVPVLLLLSFLPDQSASLVRREAQAGSSSSEPLAERSLQENIEEVSRPFLPYELPPETPPIPPDSLNAYDTPNDNGRSITVTWNKSEDTSVVSYEVLRSSPDSLEFQLVGTVPLGTERFEDNSVTPGGNYRYLIRVKVGDLFTDSPATDWVTAKAQWFNTRRANMFIATLLISSLVLLFIQRARRGRELYIRKIAGLEAVEEAIGRATEMGRSVLYIPGILDMDDIQTIASMVILGRVAKKAAEFDVNLHVPVSRSLVMTTAQEVVKEAYLNTGKPDAFQADRIHYITDEQFAYAAALDGIMLRDKPATVLYFGAFYAESLILAETGHSIGAIQIAGTAMEAQLPFFVTACDYTLIGEEIFAASAYLSKEPLLLGSLKGQDWGKAVFIGLIVLGVILETIGIEWLTKLLVTG